MYYEMYANEQTNTSSQNYLYKWNHDKTPT